MILAGDVIQQLNEADSGRGLRFPHFGTFFPVDVRLSAYRDETGWVLLIETLVFNDGSSHHNCITTMLYCYGDALPQAPGRCEPLYVTNDGPHEPLFDSQDIMGHLVSSTATDITVRDRVIPITTEPAKYAAAGIKLRDPPRIMGYELLRLLVPAHRRLFFATESEIASRIGRNMPLLIRLDEWHHPDNEAGETPADSESFQMIAEAIAANDPKLYQPAVSPNTHWVHWPTAGML